MTWVFLIRVHALYAALFGGSDSDVKTCFSSMLSLVNFLPRYTVWYITGLDAILESGSYVDRRGKGKDYIG